MQFKLLIPLACFILLLPAFVNGAQLCEEPLDAVFDLTPAAAAAPDDREALRDVEVGRIFWDVTLADPVALAGRLGVIRQTYEDMVRQNVKPEMIFAFRGGAVRLLATDLAAAGVAQREEAAVVQKRLSALLELPGVRMESCYIAMRRVPLEPQQLLSGIHSVGNTFLSAMGYGQRGFVSIAIN
ncbi:hypothetical protein [Geoalkalibacter halelectricus]|uniref:hypothetical protein n=1 Tax=Geoalkalibacter halelectricus TaxID=2847045 RepID=UPI003D21CF3F